MFQKRIQNNNINITLIGVRHNSVHDTDYVRNYINKNNIDIACIEKDPNISIKMYGQQTKKIFGFLKQNNIDIREIDEDFDPSFMDHTSINREFDQIDNYNKPKEELLKEIRQKMKDKNQDLYDKIYCVRESTMINEIKKVIKSDNNNIIIILGECHIPEIHNRLSQYMTV